MQRFAIKIDKSVKARLKNLCRLCGIENPNQIEILNAAEWIDLTIDGEVTLSKKIADCVGIQVTKNDRMPQRICSLCVDKINDFHEFREMCEATNIQTRKLLNLPDPAKAKPIKKVTIKTDADEDVESIFGIVDTDVKPKAEPIQKSAKKLKKSTASTSTSTTTSTSANDNRFKGMTKREIEITLELERIKQEEEAEKLVNETRTKNGKKKKITAKSSSGVTDLLAPKPLNQRERKREIEQQKIDKKRKTEVKIKTPVKKIKKEPGVSCLVCDERFDKISFRDTHMVSNHRPVIFEYGCSSCLEQFNTIEDYNAHHSWHTMFKVPYKCLLCDNGATFEKLITFQRHLSICTHPSSYAATTLLSNSITCEICKKSYETQNLYEWHDCFIKHNSPCPKCQRVFIKKTVLMKHIFKCTGKMADSIPAVEMPKKAGPKSKKRKQTATNRNEILPQNSFKFEPETIIETGADETYDDDMDSSYMDTHFGDIDNEYDVANDSINTLMEPTTETTLQTTIVTNAPESSTASALMAKKSTTCTNPNEKTNTNANTAPSMLECRVKIEPLDISTLNTPCIPTDADHAAAAVNEEHVAQLPTPLSSSQTVPPLVISRQQTVPPLTIRIKKEVIQPGYGDEFDANLAQNIKQERVDETYELASTSRETHAYSIAHKKSKRRDKEKKLYKKPALLAIKIKQERMEREESENYYSDYSSMPSENFTTDTISANQLSPFDNNQINSSLPIITQIHSVLEPPSINPNAKLNPFATTVTNQTTDNSMPFIPIRIKSEFHKPLTPPPAPSALDECENHNIIDANNRKMPTNFDEMTPDANIIRNIKVEREDENSDQELQNNECDRNSSLYDYNNINIEPNSIETEYSATVITDENKSNSIDMSNELVPPNGNFFNSKTISARHTNVASTTMEPVPSLTHEVTSEQLSSVIPVVESISMQSQLETENKDDDILSQTEHPMQPETEMQSEILDPNKKSAKLINQEILPCPNEVQSTHEIESPIDKILTNESEFPIESTEDKLNENGSNEQMQLTLANKNIPEENNCHKIAVTNAENITDECQYSIEVAAANAEIESMTNAKAIGSGDDDLNAVVVTNENISPIDFNEQNTNDDSLNFIDQLVHEVADTMNENISIKSTQISYESSENFEYTIGLSQQVNDDGNDIKIDEQFNTQENEMKTTTNDALLTLSDIPDIDYNDLLPALNAESDANGSDANLPIETPQSTASTDRPI